MPRVIARSRRATPLTPIRDYLQAHLDEPVSIATLVRMSGLTAFHLIRAFRREFGLPPHAYQIRLRLARARELLARGVAISQTAYECGFADQSHLSRQFKDVYGVTPAAWLSAAAEHDVVIADHLIQQLRTRRASDDGDIVPRSAEPGATRTENRGRGCPGGGCDRQRSHRRSTMTTSDTIKAELQQARDELRRAASEARAGAAQAKEELRQRIAKVQTKRDSLRAKLNEDLITRMQSLESEKTKLADAARAQAADVRSATEGRIHDVEKKISTVRDEFGAQADLTLADVDDDISSLEARAKAAEPAARQRVDAAVKDLKARRDQLRAKAAVVRAAGSDRLRQAAADYEMVVAELTEKRNQGMVGIN